MKARAKQRGDKKLLLGNKKKDLVLVRSAIEPEVRFYAGSELADDIQIRDEVLNNAIGKCVYEFQSKEGMVRGLSSVGVRECVRLLNRNMSSGYKITIGHCFTDAVELNGQKGILAKAEAIDHITGQKNWGVKFESFKKARRGGSVYDDTFVIEKAVTKAQRNAMLGLIPIGLREAMIGKFVKQGNVQQITAPKETTVVKELPKPPKETKEEKTKALETTIQKAIEQSEDPEKLQAIAEKIEESKNISITKKKILAGQARGKANKLIEAHAQTS